MKAATGLAGLLLVLWATAAGAGINLSLDDCGRFGGQNAVASCGSNDGAAMVLVGSAIPPAGIDRMVAAEGYLDVRVESGAISSWWALDGCRASALLVNANFVAGPYSCNDFWAGQGTAIGGVSPVHVSPDHFQIKLICATPGENAIAPGIEHYLFKVIISRAKSTGAGSCEGCNDAACLALSKVVLVQPAGVGDHVLTEAADRNWVTYNAGPTPAECPGVMPTLPQQPIAPLLATPANHAIDVPTSPVLVWHASESATSYRLQVSNGVSFSVPVVDQAGITDTSWAIASLAPNKVHYWRVNASNSAGTSGYSPTWSFTTVQPDPPPAPALATPPNGATDVSANPTLAWYASQGASSYRVQISTDPAFGTQVVDQANLTSTTNVFWLQAGTHYYWRVSASNSGGTSAYSETWSFTTATAPPPPPPTPVLASPPNGTTGAGSSQVLSWNASAGATAYRVQVATNPNFVAPLLNQGDLAATSVVAGPLASGTTYYWHVNATNGVSTSSYSTTWSFSTSVLPPPPPAAPVLSSPPNGATGVPARPTLGWYPATGATSYRVQVARDPAFEDTVFSQGGLTATSVIPPTLAASTVHYWRVGASNAGGASEYSPAWSFTTAAPPPPPTVPVLVAPPDGATGVPTSTTLSWYAVAGADTYTMQLATDPDFVVLVSQPSGLTQPSAPVQGLAGTTTYYWRVRATNAAGTSAFSQAWSFTTGQPPPPPTPGYMNLSLNECGPAGTMDATADCASNDGVAIPMVGSVVAPSGIQRMVACEAYIDVQTSAATLSPWWTLDGCRASALVFSADFLTGFGVCHDFWAGRAQGGGGISPYHASPNRFQIKLVFATPDEQPIEAGIEHYLFRVNILRARSAGTGSCAGCDEGACLVLNRVVLNQPAGVGDYVITMPASRSFVRYVGGPTAPGQPPPGCGLNATPAKKRSWGQIKALFR